MLEPIDFDDLPKPMREKLESFEILLMTGNRDHAVGLLRDVVARYPAWLPGRVNLSLVLSRGGATDEATEVLEAAARDFGPVPEITAQRAVLCSGAGRHEEALALAEQALADGYAWPVLHGVRADALLALGRDEEGTAALLEAYEGAPHGWKRLQQYCERTGRSFVPPGEQPPSPTSPLHLLWLHESIERAANTPDESGVMPGCDHSLRFSRAWAERADVDPIALFQFLNGRGGFCDCEVIYNTTEEDGHVDEAWVQAIIEEHTPDLLAALDARGEQRWKTRPDGTLGVDKVLVPGGELGRWIATCAERGVRLRVAVLVPDHTRSTWLCEVRDGGLHVEPADAETDPMMAAFLDQAELMQGTPMYGDERWG